AKHMEYKCRERTEFAEEDIPLNASVDNALVCFVSVEREDNEYSAVLGAEEIMKIARDINPSKILIYPYAHLSTKLAGPDIALEVLKELENRIRGRGLDTIRAPFGWYKEFTLECWGHPLSEAFREIRPIRRREEVVSEIKSKFVILTPDGREIGLEDYKKVGDDSLIKFIEAEVLGKAPAREPPSVEGMKKHALIDYETASDAGHFRFYPKGALIFNLIKEWADSIARRLNAIEVFTPLIYDWSFKDIREQAESFHERHYLVYPPDMRKEYVLRFAGDFGLFRMMKDAIISYKQLPLRIYEFTQSFRYERRGELAALRRLRAFHMPDIHSFSATIKDGWEEYKEIYRVLSDAVEDMGIEYAIAFRIVKDFYKKYREEILSLIKYSGKPALIEILSSRKHYWAVKHEFQGIDSVGNNCQLCTVQLDVEDAERYGIMYVDKDGKKKGCIICHVSVGSIERWIYQVLEEAYKMEKPSFPFWLAPTQLRIIPVGEEYIEECIELATALTNTCRVDVDDREMSVAKKVREAEKEWVPLIIVYGERERKSGIFNIRVRGKGEEKMSMDELMAKISSYMDDKPFIKLSLPILLSKRINFR
ncbi:MAG: threonine--tRNA ligase, partial [Thermoplasmata archaeon]